MDKKLREENISEDFYIDPIVKATDTQDSPTAGMLHKNWKSKLSKED